MKQRGRQSARNPGVIPIHSAMRRIDPPSDLTPSETSLFRQIVATCPHLVQADAHLLVSFVQATLLSRRAATALETDKTTAALNLWERAVRTQAALALRLRLAPSARTDPQTVARQQAAQTASAYEMMEDTDDAS